MAIAPEEQLTRFGGRVRELRLEQGLSQERFAELAGIHRTYISGMELGHRNVGLLNVFRMAAALGVDTADLFVDGRTRRARR